ncbi:MAG: ribosome small subunit-dependent GTPase A [Lachnoclostridium sp.]|jgi:ribosome biogenesis GTPase|nr:ribosome small subunit-dependent GTPase A [Lachnoclostridium sp.]
MQGKIIKGIGGFYYVYCNNATYECKAKGLFRKEKIKPLVGDNVQIEILDKANAIGNITQIYSRASLLVRPAVANIDQALVIFAAAVPDPNLNLLDRFIVMMKIQKIDTLICFNKQDIVSDEEIKKLLDVYYSCDNKVFAISSKEETGMDEIRQVLNGKTTVLAGPSGVGKSSVINKLYPFAKRKTGSVSTKIGRGKHTTRHSELFHIGNDTYIMDTPGFSTLTIPDIEKEELKQYFSEFGSCEDKCKFNGCVHVNEPDCEVKNQVKQGHISKIRYQSYLQMYEELRERKKY